MGGQRNWRIVTESVFPVTDDFVQAANEAEIWFLRNAANTLLAQAPDSELRDEIAQSLQSWDLALCLPAIVAKAQSGAETSAVVLHKLHKRQKRIIRSLRKVIKKFSWICSGCETKNSPIDDSNPFKVRNCCVCCHNVRSSPLS